MPTYFVCRPTQEHLQLISLSAQKQNVLMIYDNAVQDYLSIGKYYRKSTCLRMREISSDCRTSCGTVAARSALQAYIGLMPKSGRGQVRYRHTWPV